MSLLTKDYNSGGSAENNSGDNDYEDRDKLSLANYAIASFAISRVNEHTGDYGQNVYLDVDDVRVKHGMLYDRQWVPDGESEDTYEDSTMKVFGFGDWFDTNEDGTLAEEIDEKYINHRISQTHGNNTFPFEFEALTQEGDDEIEMGNMSMKLKNSTKYRTILKVITEAGHDVIDDKDDDFSWANEEKIQLRDDIQGRRIVLFYKKKSFTPDGDDEEVTYTDSVLLDEKTESGITIQNGESSSSSDSSSSDSDDDAGGSLGGNDGLPDGVPEEADDIIGFLARTEETDRDEIDTLVGNEADEYDLDAVVEEVEARMD